MSEYQYFEFQAVDRPLTKTEQGELRACSTRAAINSRLFKNVYHWGDFKGNPLEWMKRYFDAHLYDSNFSSRAIYLRLPLAALDAATAKPYLVKDALVLTETSDHFILYFHSDEESGYSDEDEERNDRLDAILPVRAALACGDRRALYLGWLRGVLSGLLYDETPEPPVPPGLASLDDAHQSLADFLEIDPDLIAAAATASATLPRGLSIAEAAPAWLATVTPSEKDRWLLRVLTSDDSSAAAEFRQQFQRSRTAPISQNTQKLRTAGSLLKAMTASAEMREDALAAARSASEFARQQKAAVARRAHLESLKGREENLWKSIAALTATASATNYASAVKQLTDLRDLSRLTGKTGDFRARFTDLTERHHRKAALLGRLRTAGLL